MAKYVKTIVKKSSVIPWISDVVSTESTYLTEVEKQMVVAARTEGESFPGFLNFNVMNVGNTQIVSFEFDTIENVNNFVNKTQKVTSETYDTTTATVKFNRLVSEKIKEIGLSDAYRVSTSTET
jgi:hypothetical protein